MTTIEEMALKAYPPTPDPRSDCDDGWDYNEQYRDCYIEGAKAVLEEIENLTNNQNWCAFPRQSHKELKELIEQLKK